MRYFQHFCQKIKFFFYIAFRLCKTRRRWWFFRLQACCGWLRVCESELDCQFHSEETLSSSSHFFYFCFGKFSSFHFLLIFGEINASVGDLVVWKSSLGWRDRLSLDAKVHVWIERIVKCYHGNELKWEIGKLIIIKT